MYAIAIEEKFLEGVPDLSFELQNAVFTSADTAALPGSFSFPFTLPATRRNRVTLGQPALISNVNNPKKIENVWAYLHGSPIFFGDLYVRSANKQGISVNFVANFLGKIRDAKLNELDYGGIRVLSFGDTAAARATAKASFLNPGIFDFIFLPVYNPEFLENPTGSLPSLFTNYYDTAAGEFYEGVDNLAATPFPKLKYILSRIFAATEFAFDNGLQTELSELNNLYLWNNRSIYTPANQWGTRFEMRNHVSDMKVRDFLRQLSAVFNLGIFSNIFSKTVRLVPLADLLRREPKSDWTRYAGEDFQIDFEDTGAPDGYAYQSDSDALNERYLERRDSLLGEHGDVKGEYEFLEDLQDASPPPAAGIYYVHDRAGFFVHAGTFGQVTFGWQELGAQPSTYTRGQRVAGDEIFKPELLPVWDGMRLSHDVPGNANPYPQTPYVRKQGIVTWTDAGAEVKQNGDFEMRLLFYRGLYPGAQTGNYPLGAGSRYLEFGQNAAQPFNYSLRWDGEYGLYQKFWQPWHQMLRYGKHLTATFILPVSELIHLQFDEKIRIASMDYFVKKLRVGKPAGGRRVVVEASLISVI